MSNTNSLEAAKLAFLALEDKLAEDIRVLDISKISTLSDYFAYGLRRYSGASFP